MRILLIVAAFFQVLVLRAQDTVLVFSGDLESQKTHLIAIDMLIGGKKDICEVKDYKFIFQRSSVYDAAGGKMYFLGDDGNINTRRFVETDVKTGQINRSVPDEPEWNYVNYCFHEGYKVVFAQQFLNAAPTNKTRICWLDLSTQTWNELIKLPGQVRLIDAEIDAINNWYLYAAIDYSGNAFINIVDIASRKLLRTVPLHHPAGNFSTYSIQDFFYHPGTQTAYFLNLNAADTIEILQLDINTGQVQRKMAFAANEMHFTGSSTYDPDKNTIYFSTHLAANTLLFTYNANTNKLTQTELDNKSWNYVLLSDMHLYKPGNLPAAQSYKPLATNFNTFPNPSTGAVNLDGISGGSEVFVYTNTGRQIMHYTENPSQLDFSGLPAGQYFIRIVADGKAQTQTVIIHP